MPSTRLRPTRSDQDDLARVPLPGPTITWLHMDRLTKDSLTIAAKGGLDAARVFIEEVRMEVKKCDHLFNVSSSLLYLFRDWIKG